MGYQKAKLSVYDLATEGGKEESVIWRGVHEVHAGLVPRIYIQLTGWRGTSWSAGSGCVKFLLPSAILGGWEIPRFAKMLVEQQGMTSWMGRASIYAQEGRGVSKCVHL